MIDTSFRASGSAAQTMPSTLTAPSTPTAAPTPADRPLSHEPAAHPFAEMLRQQRSPVAPRPVTANADASAAAARNTARPSAASHGEASAGTTGSANAWAREAALAKARDSSPHTTAHTDADAASNTDETTAKSSAADGSEAKDKAAGTGADAAQNGAALPVPSAALALRAAAADARANATSPGDAASGSGSASPAGVTGPDGNADATAAALGGAAASRGAGRLDPDAFDKTAVAVDLGGEKTAPSPFAESLAEAKAWTGATSSAERTTHDLSTAVNAAGMAGASTTSNTTAGTAPASATVAPPIDAPDFAAAFGMQVSVLAKDGVQQASLHLNPAEMGPVSIRITLDGTLAHVDFGADVAATRHAIEAGLPELASALQDAGFTLAGGGVAQHSASNDSGGSAGSDDGTSSRSGMAPAGKAAVGAIDAAARRQSLRIASGGVDLFA